MASELFEDPSWWDRIAPAEGRLDPDALMDLAIAIARESSGGGGGPFGAVVATEEGTLVSFGWNAVIPACDSTAHAEVVAIRRAELRLGVPRLRGDDLPPLVLYASCAPCILCTGAIHWSGIPRVVTAARREDAEAIGFVEGTVDLDVPEFLESRGIAYRGDFRRAGALRVLAEYQGPIYNG